VSPVYTIWPCDRDGVPAAVIATAAWQQDRHWLVLDVTEGLERSHVVEGPVTLAVALHRELELRTTARTTRPAVHKEHP